MSSFAGGGGTIYEDGEPFVEELNTSESITVPAGETWIVNATFRDSGNTSNTFKVNGVDGFASDTVNAGFVGQQTFPGGTTLESDNNLQMIISGVAL